MEIISSFLVDHTFCSVPEAAIVQPCQIGRANSFDPNAHRENLKPLECSFNFYYAHVKLVAC